MTKRNIFRHAFLLITLAFAALASGCARYAPVAAPPSRTLLDITIQTKAPITSDFFYYIVLDASGNPASDGPHEALSGVQRLQNWTYYIVYNSGGFYELQINNPADRDAIPNLFNASSPRFSIATVNVDTIHIVMYLDQLAPTPRPIWLNFITSTIPVYANIDTIQPVDYITPPYFSVPSDQFNSPVTSFQRPQISAHAPSGTGLDPADIVYWSVEVAQR